MEQDLKIREEIITGNNLRKKEFFLDKLKNDLKKNGLTCSDQILEELFMKAAFKYDSSAKANFYFFCLRKIRDILDKENEFKYVKNDLFSRQEFIIIAKYLKNTDGFYSSETIANELGITPIEVSNTIHKLRSYCQLKKDEVLELFPEAYGILKERENSTGRKKSAMKKNMIDESFQENMKILGYYTGQIDDICLDIDEIAKKYNTLPGIITYRLKDFIMGLKDKKKYNYLLTTYPEILDMLVLKTKALGLKPENIFDKELIKAKKKVKIKTKATLKVKPRCVNYKKNTEVKKDNASFLKVRELKYLEFLKVAFRVKDDGSYLSKMEISKELGVTYQAVTNKFLKMDEILGNTELVKKYLRVYPTLIEDKDRYFDYKLKACKKVNKEPVGKEKNTYVTEQKKFEEYVKILKLIYKRTEDNRYLSFDEIVKELGISNSYIFILKNTIFEELRNDNSDKFRNYVKENYKELEEDILEYNKLGGHTGVKKLFNYIELLKKIYIPAADGKYLSFSEIGNHYKSMQNFYKTKAKALSMFKENEAARKFIIEIYPTILEDMEIKRVFEDINVGKKNTLNDNYSQKIAFKYKDFLENIFEYENNFLEYASKMGLSIDELKAQLDKMLLIISNEDNLRNNFGIMVPDYLEKIEKFNSYFLNTQEALVEDAIKRRNNITEDFTKDYALFLRLVYGEKKGSYGEFSKLLKKLNFNNILSGKLIINNAINKDEDLRSEILKLYPEYYSDKEAYENNRYETSQKSLKVEKAEERLKNKAKKMAKVLKTIYQPNDEKLYRSNEEIREILGCSQNYHYKILKEVDDVLKDEKLVRLIILEYPTFLEDKKKYELESTLNLKKSQKKFADDNLLDVTRATLSNTEISRKMALSLVGFGTLEKKTLEKIRLSETLSFKYPTALRENTIRKISSGKKDIITLSEEELNNIRVNSRKLDLPGRKIDSKSTLIEGISRLEKSVYKDFISLCTYEQKAILALKLGFFNKTIFSTTDVAKMFLVSSEYVEYLTNECLKTLDLEKKGYCKIKNS